MRNPPDTAGLDSQNNTTEFLLNQTRHLHKMYKVKKTSRIVKRSSQRHREINKFLFEVTTENDDKESRQQVVKNGV